MITETVATAVNGRCRRIWLPLAFVGGLLVIIAASGAIIPADAASGPSVEPSANESNETDWIPHEDPTIAVGDGDPAAVADVFSGTLGESATTSAIELREGDLEGAREPLGDEYEAWLRQYDAIADTTGREGTVPDLTRDEQAVETFAELQGNQTELVDLAEDGEAILADYEAAQERGDDGEARAHARELVELAEEVETTGESVEGHYTELEEFTDDDLEEARDAIETVVNTAGAGAAQLADENFLATTIEVESAPESIAYDDPLVVEGRLIDEEGEAVTDAEIVLATPDGMESTTTDDEGRFELRYRPVTLPVTTAELDIEYRPVPTAPYEPTAESIDVDVEQTTAVLDVALPGDTAAGGDTLETSLTATVNEEPVDGLPVVASAAGTTAEANTGPTGTATPAVTVPFDFPTGTTTVEFTTVGGLAVESDPVERDIEIVETDTDLDLSADADETTVRAAGTLTTVDGIPVGEQPVQLEMDEYETIVETAADGSFAATFEVDEPGDRIVVATYDEAGVNLVGSTAETLVTVPQAAGTDPVAEDESWIDAIGGPLATIGVVLAVLTGIAATVVYRRRRSQHDMPAEPVTESAVERSSVTDESAEELPAPEPPAPDPPSVLERARAELPDAPNRATTLAYGHTRGTLSEDTDNADTHWEFYRACEANGLDDRAVQELKTITEHYERATFAPDGIGPDSAAEAIDAAERIEAE